MRHVLRLTIGLALAAVAAACTSAVGGHGTALTPSSPSTSAAASSGSSGPSSFPTGPAPSGGPSSATPAQLAQLTALLEPRPAGAVPWNTAWGTNINPTLEQFAVHDYAASYVPTAETLLRSEGLIGIAHRTWTDADGTQADVVLLQFATPDGAVSRFQFASQAKRASPGEEPLVVPGAGDTIGLSASTVDQDGYIRAIVYSHRGAIVAQTFIYSPAHLNSSDAIAWSTAQLARLPQ